VILIILWIVAVPAKGLAVSDLEVAIEFFQVVFIILCIIIEKYIRPTRLDLKNM
jgi:hypothetical protein